MKTINKKLAFVAVPGTVTERLSHAMDTEKNTGNMNRAMTQWITAGFQLQELGAGVIETWLAMEKNGEMASLTRAQKAHVLANLLARVDNLPGQAAGKPPAKKETPIDSNRPRTTPGAGPDKLADLG